MEISKSLLIKKVCGILYFLHNKLGIRITINSPDILNHPLVMKYIKRIELNLNKMNFLKEEREEMFNVINSCNNLEELNICTSAKQMEIGELYKIMSSNPSKLNTCKISGIAYRDLPIIGKFLLNQSNLQVLKLKNCRRSVLTDGSFPQSIFESIGRMKLLQKLSLHKLFAAGTWDIAPFFLALDSIKDTLHVLSLRSLLLGDIIVENNISPHFDGLLMANQLKELTLSLAMRNTNISQYFYTERLFQGLRGNTSLTKLVLNAEAEDSEILGKICKALNGNTTLKHFEMIHRWLGPTTPTLNIDEDYLELLNNSSIENIGLKRYHSENSSLIFSTTSRNIKKITFPVRESKNIPVTLGNVRKHSKIKSIIFRQTSYPITEILSDIVNINTLRKFVFFNFGGKGTGKKNLCVLYSLLLENNPNLEVLECRVSNKDPAIGVFAGNLQQHPNIRRQKLLIGCKSGDLEPIRCLFAPAVQLEYFELELKRYRSQIWNKCFYTMTPLLVYAFLQFKGNKSLKTVNIYGISLQPPFDELLEAIHGFYLDNITLQEVNIQFKHIHTPENAIIRGLFDVLHRNMLRELRYYFEFCLYGHDDCSQMIHQITLIIGPRSQKLNLHWTETFDTKNVYHKISPLLLYLTISPPFKRILVNLDINVYPYRKRIQKVFLNPALFKDFLERKGTECETKPIIDGSHTLSTIKVNIMYIH